MSRVAIITLLALALLVAASPGTSGQEKASATPAKDTTCPSPEPRPSALASPSPTPEPGRAAPTPTPALDRDAAVDPRLDPLAATAASALQACWNAGDWEAVTALVTPRFLETAFGSVAPDSRGRAQALASLALGPMHIESIGPVGIWNDGRGAVDVFYRRGQGDPHQAIAARWHIVAERGHVWFDEENLLLPRRLGDRITVGFSIPDDEQTLQWASLDSSRIPATPVTLLHGANRGRLPHTFILEDENGRALGLLTLPAGRQADLVLLDLPPGSYRLHDPAVPGSEQTLVVE